MDLLSISVKRGIAVRYIALSPYGNWKDTGK